MNSGFDNGNESIGIALKEPLSNRPAIGSQIDLVTENTFQSRIVHAGENYLSQENEVELFGLRNQAPQEVMVHWPSGLQERFLADHPWLDPHGATCAVGRAFTLPSVRGRTRVVQALRPSNGLGSPFRLLRCTGRDQTGQSIEVNNDFQWEPSMGDLVMHATWNGVTTCSVMHHIVFEPMPGDLT